VKSGDSVKNAAGNAVLNGTLQAASVPVAAAVAVGGTACAAVYVASRNQDQQNGPDVHDSRGNEHDTHHYISEEVRRPIQQPRTSPENRASPLPNPDQRQSTSTQTDSAGQATGSSNRHSSNIGELQNSARPTVPAEYPSQLEQRLVHDREATISYRQSVYRGGRMHQPEYERLQSRYRTDLQNVQRIREDAERGRITLTERERLKLQAFESATLEEAQMIDSARRGDVMAEQQFEREAEEYRGRAGALAIETIRRWEEIIGRQFLERLNASVSHLW